MGKYKSIETCRSDSHYKFYWSRDLASLIRWRRRLVKLVAKDYRKDFSANRIKLAALDAVVVQKYSHLN